MAATRLLAFHFKRRDGVTAGFNSFRINTSRRNKGSSSAAHKVYGGEGKPGYDKVCVTEPKASSNAAVAGEVQHFEDLGPQSQERGIVAISWPGERHGNDPLHAAGARGHDDDPVT